MKLGVHFANFTLPGGTEALAPTLAATASAADEGVTGTDPLLDPDAFLTAMTGYAALGIDQVWVGPRGPDPAGWVAQVTEKVLPRLLDIQGKD